MLKRADQGCSPFYVVTSLYIFESDWCLAPRVVTYTLVAAGLPVAGRIYGAGTALHS